MISTYLEEYMKRSLFWNCHEEWASKFKFINCSSTKTKFANVVDTVKRKYSFTDSETSTSTSSDDLLYLDILTIKSVVSQEKNKKNVVWHSKIELLANVKHVVYIPVSHDLLLGFIEKLTNPYVSS